MRRKSPAELIMEAQRIGAAEALPGRIAIKATGVPDVSKEPETVSVKANPETALIERMSTYAVTCINHRLRRERLIGEAIELARTRLGQASDQHELDAEIAELVTRDLG